MTNAGSLHFRTSASDPLWIDSLPVGSAGGRVGMTICPGKQAESLVGAPWRRDLAADLKTIADWGASVVITLTEPDEMVALGVDHMGSAVSDAGMQWLHLPIADQHAPDHRFDGGWAQSGPALIDRLREGQRVLVHCRGGLGRAGTVAAWILMAFGCGSDDAIRLVRSERRGAIETAAQVEWLKARNGLNPPLRRQRHVTAVELKSRDFWVKVVGFLQHNWALIEQEPGMTGRTVFFVDDLGGVFDRLAFDSVLDAQTALARNGFVRYPDSDEMAQLLTPPESGSFHERAHSSGPIYSSGRYWR